VLESVISLQSHHASGLPWFQTHLTAFRSILCRTKDCDLQHHHTPSVRKHTIPPSFLQNPAVRKVFCSSSMSCIRLALAAVLGLARWVAAEGAMQVVPSTSQMMKRSLWFLTLVHNISKIQTAGRMGSLLWFVLWDVDIPEAEENEFA
jgi:hypothetical protein